MRPEISFYQVAIAFVASLFFLLPAQANAQEVINSFSSDIVLRVDGSVDVTEIIKVRAEGTKIRRGIFRDIPTVLINDNGSRLLSNLKVISVEKNGSPEPFFTRSIPDGTRIFIGKSDVYLSVGTYTYVVRYTMTRMARYFEDYDELYWNATGNFWDFPIESAVAKITLPDGAIIRELNVYTGRQGETGSDANFKRSGDNSAVFQATRAFAPGEGMSISATFDKGILSEPEGAQKALNFLSDNRATILPLIAVVLVLLYFYVAWDAVGRDPKKGTIIPLFYPPKGFSAALVHYVHRMGWRKNGWTAYSAALVSLAVQGLVEIGKNKKKSTFTSLKKTASRLPPGEKVINDYLISKRKIVVSKSTGPGLNKNRAKFVRAIASENQSNYFNNNYLYVLGGIVLSVVCLIVLAVAGVLGFAVVIGLAGAGFGIGVMSIIVMGAWTGGGFSRFISFFVLSIVIVNMAGTFGRVFSQVPIDTAVIASVSIVAINILFGIWMRAPTIQGRKLMDQIEGFKLYLETAEKERLNFRREPDLSVERFEEILPYAIALGVEKPWASRFEGELARNALADSQRGYHPSWYSGSGFSSSTLGKDVAGIASGMSAAMMSAQPSSSSGGGGGGSSGGGGGGGGGGGW